MVMKLRNIIKTTFSGGLFFCLCHLSVYADEIKETTLKKKIEELQSIFQVNFSYDSSIGLSLPYRGRKLDGLPLEQALKTLFAHTGITWKFQGKYVILYAPKPPMKKYTISGNICQSENGEALINATILDLNTGYGTLTNASGFFSMTLPEGEHRLCISFVGCNEQIHEFVLDKDTTLTCSLKQSLELQEVVITGDLNAPLETTQTGKVTFNPKELKTEYALLSSPDLIKTLQNQAGVAAGTELISGLYVHGGTNDGNLFLLDGTPIYQVNHMGGLFSAFNTDVIKNVDFYKSGFPARYGGRLSSVTDVHTKDGDMNHFHGSFSLGLLDGRIQFEGPIVKKRTSFNIAMRRSWMDLFTSTAMAVYNAVQNAESANLRYSFHDINAKITHRFSGSNKLAFNFYSGRDVWKVKNEYNRSYSFPTDNLISHDLYQLNLNWGNLITSLNWNLRLSSNLFGNFTAVYTHNRSSYDYLSDTRYYQNSQEGNIIYQKTENHSAINDVGYRLELDYRPNINHHIRLGSNYLYHYFNPQKYTSSEYHSDFMRSIQADTLQTSNQCRYRGSEFTLYAEDDILLSKHLRTNIGIHYTLFNVNNKTYHIVEPRIALRYRWAEFISSKLSYTEMSQYVQQISTTYLNLPTDFWVPSTQNIRPMRSKQIAFGVYMNFPANVRFAVEGYYQLMNNLLVYKGKPSLSPSASSWEQEVRSGKGRSYGIELSASYANTHTSLDAAYTLSWSKRKFDAVWRGWYPDKFDNRHKFNVTFRHKFSHRIEAMASWTYHSGNKITLPAYYVPALEIPGLTENYTDGVWDLNNLTGSYIYDRPNNLSLPAYHRLDLGINFRHITKRGFERIWNISIYNAYCRMNAITAKVSYGFDGKLSGKAKGIFPIIPSFSYTLKF